MNAHRQLRHQAIGPVIYDGVAVRRDVWLLWALSEWRGDRFDIQHTIWHFR